MDANNHELRDIRNLKTDLTIKWRSLTIKALGHDPRISNGHRIAILEYYVRLMGRAFVGLGISYAATTLGIFNKAPIAYRNVLYASTFLFFPKII